MKLKMTEKEADPEDRRQAGLRAGHGFSPAQLCEEGVHHRTRWNDHSHYQRTALLRIAY